MLFEPFPISTRPTLRVSREFLFDADARAVRDYFLGGNGRESRVIEIAQPPFHLWGRICRGTYRLFVTVSSGQIARSRTIWRR